VLNSGHGFLGSYLSECQANDVRRRLSVDFEL
jgi:hypothetical protein